MRIADKMNFNQVDQNIQRNRAEMNDLQNQAATQKRVNKPGDDPLAVSRILGARTEVAGDVQFVKSINVAKSYLEYSEQSLGELADALIRAKELAVGQANDAGASPRTREVVAAEVEQLHSQAIQIGNRKLGDRYLFGGFKTTRPPFSGEGHYRGDDGLMQINVAKDGKIAMNVPGSRVFLGKNLRGAPLPIPPENERGELNEIELQAGGDGESERPSVGRGPASVRPPAVATEGEPPKKAQLSETWRAEGTNVFQALKTFEIALRTNDKPAIQNSLDTIDEAIAQVVLVRSEIGARVGTLNSGLESLQKNQVDQKTLASSLEDVDAFELVSDINKSESTLKATLATSGKLIQPTLLDFLR